MSDNRFQPARPRRAFEEIISQIRSGIRDGSLRPGDRLPAERALAEQFEVSRNTVREAMRMLEIAGLVELRRGATGGAFVAHADPSRIASSISDQLELGSLSLSELTEARGWIESIVVRVACERADEATLDRLEANIVEAARLTDEEQWEKKALVHIEFHNILAEATGNKIIIATMASLMEVMRTVVLAIGPTRDDMITRSRSRLLERLRARDTDGAVEEMTDHLGRLHTIWLEASYEGARRPR
ncbi:MULTISPECIES: FadR/GntR family transcriptional regulator [unclassified Pseudonocardia]|uniref:FadR/GntR family transcriptional regulator n=1 Tax=unclassified Pseudonocardia TaxID=2619320 RepID=UPI000760DFE4|nr:MULTISPECIES: GntR family transcriptional regulator [unclassified Pseudonocardia]